MIKKIMITILSVLTIITFFPSVHAATVLVPEPPISTGGLWHVEDGNRVYIYMRYYDGYFASYETGQESNTSFPTYDYSQYTYWRVGSTNDYMFPNTGLKYDTISNPDPTVYDKFVVDIIPNMLVTSGPEPTFKTVVTYDSVVDTVRVNLYDYADRPNTNYLYDYSYLTLSVDGVEVLSSRNVNQDVATALGFEANPNYIDMAFGVRMYWEKTSTEPVIDPGTTEEPWTALPLTTGSPVNPIGDWGIVTNITVVNQTVSFEIEYQGIQYPIQSFTVDGDLDFISKSNDVLYYSDPNTDDRILYFNFGDTLDSAILTARSYSDVSEWKGEALWNLTQNDIKVTNVMRIYNYIPEVGSDGNVYSYFYMPDVPMDDLISVSAVLAYQYWDDGFLGIGDPKPGPTQYMTVSAVRGETSTATPTWVEGVYTGAYIASTLVTPVSVINPAYGWMLLSPTLFVGYTLLADDVNNWVAYDIQQIEHVIPDIALANNINNYIAEVGGTDQVTVDTDNLYKLHLATLQDGDKVQVLGDLSNVTQVVWETDGQIYVVNTDYIQSIDWGGPGTDVPVFNNPFDIPDEAIWLTVGVVGFIAFFKLKLDKRPGLLILLLAVAVYFLYQIGLI